MASNTPQSTWVPLTSKPLNYHLDKLFRRGYHHLDVGERKVALSPRQRELVGSINRSYHPLAYLRRKHLARMLDKIAPSELRMRNSYLLANIASAESGLPVVLERQIGTYMNFLKDGDESLKAAGIKPGAYRAEMKRTLDDPLKHIPFRYDEKVAREIVGFCVRPQFLAIAARYLGVLPILGPVFIFYSPNADAKLTRAQLFHIDPEGRRQVKMFMAIRPVGSDNGPFTFVPGDKSRAMFTSGDKRYQNKRVTDDEIREFCPQSEWIAHTGSFGDAVFVDTSSCFHYGSRPSKTHSPRLLLHASYLDPFCSIFPVKNPLGAQRKKFDFMPNESCIFPDYVLGRKL